MIAEKTMNINWNGIAYDLVRKGGINQGDITADSYLMSNGCTGVYKKNNFFAFSDDSNNLSVSSKSYNPELIEAFSRLLDSKPFAKYTHRLSGLVSFEWSPTPNERFEELERQKKENLERLID